jgi:hypothetical protein
MVARKSQPRNPGIAAELTAMARPTRPRRQLRCGQLHRRAKEKGFTVTTVDPVMVAGGKLMGIERESPSRPESERRTGVVRYRIFSESFDASCHAQIMPHERRSCRDSVVPFSVHPNLRCEPVRLLGCHSQQSSQWSVPLPIDPRLTRLDENRVLVNNPDDLETTQFAIGRSTTSRRR